MSSEGRRRISAMKGENYSKRTLHLGNINVKILVGEIHFTIFTFEEWYIFKMELK